VTVPRLGDTRRRLLALATVVIHLSGKDSGVKPPHPDYWESFVTIIDWSNGSHMGLTSYLKTSANEKDTGPASQNCTEIITREKRAKFFNSELSLGDTDYQVPDKITDPASTSFRVCLLQPLGPAILPH